MIPSTLKRRRAGVRLCTALALLLALVAGGGAPRPPPGGPAAAYWYSWQTGQFVSPSYYFDRLPDWASAFNAARPADKFFGQTWDRLLDRAEYERRAGADDVPWEKGDGRTPTTLPQRVTGGLRAPGPDF